MDSGDRFCFGWWRMTRLAATLLPVLALIAVSGCRSATLSLPEEARPGRIDEIRRRPPPLVPAEPRAEDPNRAPPHRRWVRGFNEETRRVFPRQWTSPDQLRVFASYDADGPAVWADNWTRHLDLTGIAWNGEAAGVLVTRQHVVFARHYQWKLGAPLVFHDRDGGRHERRLRRKRGIRGRSVDDIMVGMLDAPVPAGIKVYSLFPPEAPFDGYTLLGARAILTNRHREVVVREINAITRGHPRGRPGHLVRLKAAEGVPVFAQGQLVRGDSGHPGFLLYRGEPILLETLTYGGYGRGPYYGAPEYQAEILRIIDSWGGVAAEAETP